MDKEQIYKVILERIDYCFSAYIERRPLIRKGQESIILAHLMGEACGLLNLLPLFDLPPEIISQVVDALLKINEKYEKALSRKHSLVESAIEKLSPVPQS